MNLPGDRHSGETNSDDEDRVPKRPEPDEGTVDDAAARTARHRLAEEIASGLLPETTGDERDDGDRGGYSAAWYAENRPPHHDR